MFGYIMPEKPELKVKEYELFKAYYCGVCKSIGKRYGQLSRLTLTYDAAFLAILLSVAAGLKAGVAKERCILHPMNKRNVVKQDKILGYASDMNLVLAYYKLVDDARDEKSLLPYIGIMTLHGSVKLLKEKYREKCNIIEKRLQELSALEKSRCDSLDRASEPFARMMEEITAFEELCSDKSMDKVLRCIGYNIGKWIYLLDAYDDISEDVNKKTYNPFIVQYGYSGEKTVEEFKAEIKDRVNFNLTYCLSQIAKAYELLDKKNDNRIAENIIYMGMLRKTEQILETGSCRQSEKSI